MIRRSFLKKTAATALAACLPGIPLAASSYIHDAYAVPELLQILRDRRQIAAIGQTYRQRYPDYNDPAALRAALESDCLHAAHSTSLPEILSQQVRADFAGDRTIQLNGWILSITEARQCALYSLLYA